MRKEKIPVGIYVFGIGIFLTSIANLIAVFTNYNDYRDWYHHWPYPLFLARYCFSILQRIAGLIAAFGILELKEFGRKLAFVIGCFTISTIYLKHPYLAYKNCTLRLDQILGPMLRARGIPFTFSELTIPSMFINCLLDVSFWLIFIYYFTRPRIVKLFKPEG